MELPKSNSRVYRIWFDMKRRCDISGRKQYKDYGGRGITYTDTWATFSGFWKDMERHGKYL